MDAHKLNRDGGMRIFSAQSKTTQFAIGKSSRGLATAQRRLSTGLRINSASNDASGLSISEGLRTQIIGGNKARENIQNAMALLQIAEGALNEQSAMLQRMRTLVLQAKNNTLTQTERNFLGQEFRQLYDELNHINTSTNFNRLQLFAPQSASSSASADPKIAADNTEIYDTPVTDALFGANDDSSAHHFNFWIGPNYDAHDMAAFNPGAGLNSFDTLAANVLTVQIPQMSGNALFGTSADSAATGEMILFGAGGFGSGSNPFAMDNSVYGSPLYNGDIQLKYSALLDLIDGKAVTTSGMDLALAAAAFSGENQTGLARINQTRIELGMHMNRLGHALANAMVNSEQSQIAESVIRDADFATEVSYRARSEILSSTATGMLAQSQNLSRLILQVIA